VASNPPHFKATSLVKSDKRVSRDALSVANLPPRSLPGSLAVTKASRRKRLNPLTFTATLLRELSLR
jgi:hypothetical protein